MTQPIGTPPKESIFYGPYATLADAIVKDVDFPEGFSKYIVVGTGGSIIFENEAGVLQFIPVASTGTILPIVAKSIKSSGDVRTIARTTTATNLGWLGGY